MLVFLKRNYLSAKASKRHIHDLNGPGQPIEMPDNLIDQLPSDAVVVQKKGGTQPVYKPVYEPVDLKDLDPERAMVESVESAKTVDKPKRGRPRKQPQAN